MKIPAVGMAGAFAMGILFGQTRMVAGHAAQLGWLLGLCVAGGLLVGLAFLLTWRQFVWVGAGASLLCWMELGVLGACLAEQPLPKGHILTRVAAAEVALRTPLRWTGVLRSEPLRMPWGTSLEMGLTSVETAGGTLPVTGGMRIGYTPRAGESGLGELHTGDEIRVFAEARRPEVFKDAGAFDRREFLAWEGIHLVATLRAASLLEKLDGATGRKFSVRQSVARAQGTLRDRVDEMFAGKPEVAGILRAMLLGDRSFVERPESVDFQKTGTFHVLAVAGLHVGALGVFLYWLGRRLRLRTGARAVLILTVLSLYVLVVEQRAPVLRAGLTTAIVLFGSVLYRRLDLLNASAIAVLILLVANPKYVNDGGFLMSFLAIGCIAGLAVPFLERHVEPVSRSLREWRDVTRDAGHAPKMVQWRLDFRDAMGVVTGRLRGRWAVWAGDAGAGAVRGLMRGVELLVVSFVLQLGMLGLMARNFHRVPLLGPMANLFAVPLTSMIVPLGFLGLAVSLVWRAGARLVAVPLGWLVMAQHHVVAFFAGIPHGSYRIPGPPGWLMALFFLELVAAVAILRREKVATRWQWGTLVLFLALTAGAVAIYPFAPAVRAKELEVSVLDVGQGDAIFVVSPRGSTLLIDGGGAFQGFRGAEEHQGRDPGEEAVSSYLWSRGFQRIDTVALTHAHQDHIGGLKAVLENFRVSRLWVGRETAAPAFLRLKEEAQRLHVPVEQEWRGQSFMWDGVQVDFLWPENGTGDLTAVAKNNDSLVVRLRFGERTILLPGDAEKQVEYAMLAENAADFLHADVLKVGHHGSKNSTMPEFLAAVRPGISVISAGEGNPYGHPNEELLERLEERGTRILRTDRDGAVRILTDGKKLEVGCFVACP